MHQWWSRTLHKLFKPDSYLWFASSWINVKVGIPRITDKKIKLFLNQMITVYYQNPIWSKILQQWFPDYNSKHRAFLSYWDSLVGPDSWFILLHFEQWHLIIITSLLYCFGGFVCLYLNFVLFLHPQTDHAIFWVYRLSETLCIISFMQIPAN